LAVYPFGIARCLCANSHGDGNTGCQGESNDYRKAIEARSTTLFRALFCL
jgi:hypothetical protein